MKSRVMALRAVDDEEIQLCIVSVDSCCSPCSNQSSAELESPEGILNWVRTQLFCILP